MESETTRSKRDESMRQASSARRIRDTRKRSLPTENNHVALRRYVGVTCVYQSDLSSRPLAPSASFGPLPRAQSPPERCPLLTGRSISASSFAGAVVLVSGLPMCFNRPHEE
jgi:hypothetical protein